MSGIHSVSIVGTGNIAHHLGKAFRDAGVPISDIYGRNSASVKELGLKLNCDVVASLDDLSGDLILLCVSDDAVVELASGILEHRRLAYTSGSVPLSSLPNRTFSGVFYPLQTFSKNRDIDISIVPFLIEGNSRQHESELMQLASRISQQVLSANSNDRLHYHISAVFVNNFVNHLFSKGKEHIEEHDLNWEVLQPLIHETMAKISDLEPLQAQTGPALRNDKRTIERHLNELEGKSKEIYTLLTQSIQQSSEK
jgi:predicted short-subunit dehydrogenase-like oxidoreductase (DUF2520 family)